MNSTEDWEVIWRWQWFRRALWLDHFRDPSHPEGRPARIAAVWDWILREHGAHRVLDSAAGIGMRAVLLSEAGYDVVGADGGAAAIEHARELATLCEREIPFHVCKWADLGDLFQDEFDAVINDEMAWLTSRSELRFTVQSLFTVLKPGGVLIFTGADQWSTVQTRAAQIEHAWQAAPRFQIMTDYENDGTHLTLVVARDLTDIGVVENYLFVVRDSAGARLETASICNSHQWGWHDFQTVCQEAGFSRVQSERVPVGRREHILNVAVK